MALCIPYIKDPENIKFLEENEQIFLEFITKEHSPFSLAHTMLHADSFNDKFVSLMRKKLLNKQKLVIQQEEKLKKQAADELLNAPKYSKPKKLSPLQKKVEKEQQAVIEAVQKKISEDDEELPE